MQASGDKLSGQTLSGCLLLSFLTVLNCFSDNLLRMFIMELYCPLNRQLYTSGNDAGLIRNSQGQLPAPPPPQITIGL